MIRTCTALALFVDITTLKRILVMKDGVVYVGE